jgi:hypothetical protein
MRQAVVTYDLNARKANQRKNRWPQPQKRGELKQRIEQLERERRGQGVGTPAEAGEGSRYESFIVKNVLISRLHWYFKKCDPGTPPPNI